MGDATAIYAAGYFDGEGCVEVYRNGARGFNNLLTITNTDRAPLDFLCDHFGGTVRERTLGPTNRRRVYRWAISGKEAEAFARAILPYAITKGEQLSAFLEFREMVGQIGRFSDRLRLCGDIRAMKAAPCL